MLYIRFSVYGRGILTSGGGNCKDSVHFMSSIVQAMVTKRAGMDGWMDHGYLDIWRRTFPIYFLSYLFFFLCGKTRCVWCGYFLKSLIWVSQGKTANRQLDTRMTEWMGKKESENGHSVDVGLFLGGDGGLERKTSKRRFIFFLHVVGQHSI